MVWRDLSTYEARKADLLREAEQIRLAKQVRQAQRHEYPSLFDILKYRFMSLWPKREAKPQRKTAVRVRGRVLVIE